MKKQQVSVIIPTYNEAENIAQLINRLHTSLSDAKYEYELIVVDDHSTDSTKSIVKQFNLPVQFHLKKGKRGKGYSLVEGFECAKFSTIAFIDADLQYAPEEIVLMIPKLAQSDIVVANRKNYKDSIVRKTLSKSFRYFFGKKLFGINYDIQAGLKVFKREVAQTISFYPSSQWTFDLEFLYKAKEAGFKIAGHDITFHKRAGGNSKVGILKTTYDIGTSAVGLRLTPLVPLAVKPDNGKTMSGAGFRYKGKKYTTHSTLDYVNSSIRTFTRSQKIFMLIVLEFLAAGLIINSMGTLGLIVAILSLIYFIDTVFNFFVVLKSLRFPQEITVSAKRLKQLKDVSLPVYSILCPLYKEAHIIPHFIESIEKLDWPKDKLDVLLLLEEDDVDSVSKVEKMNLPSYIRVIVVPESQPKTKPKACNYGLSFAKGEYLVIYDAEDMPDPLQLKKAYLSFKKVPRNVVCLQAKLNYYNPSQNLLTRFFTAEYSLWFDITLTGLQSINTSIPLGGTSNHFRTTDINKLHGWDPFNVTEDADLGMRLFKKGYKTAIIDSITLEEANSRWGNWIRQRSRWIKGYMQTYLVHTRDSWGFIKTNKLHYLVFHLVVGGKIAFILINPILWIATVSYFTLYKFVGPQIESLYPATVFYMAGVSLVFGNFLFMYYYMVGVMKREHYSLIKYVFLIPLYWLMISVAGFMALYQLFFKPFYWEKTVHGLHLLEKKQNKASTKQPWIYIPRPAFAKISFSIPVGISKMQLLWPVVLIGYLERKTVSFIAQILIYMGSFERRVVKLVTTGLIMIGKVEKNTLVLVLRSVKKVIVSPLKYAASLFM